MKLEDISPEILDTLKQQTLDHLLARHYLIYDWESAKIYFQQKNFMQFDISRLVTEDTAYWKAAKAKLGKERLFGPSHTYELSGQQIAYKNLLVKAVQDFLPELFESVKNAAQSDRPEDWEFLTREKWQPLAKYPRPGLLEVSPRQAEQNAASFLKWMGARNAEVTQVSKDNGFDVVSDLFVAQVKHLHNKVGVKALRELLGASISTKKLPVFFSKSGFSEEAYEFGIANQMLLYSYEATYCPETFLTSVYHLEGMDARYEHEPWMNLSRSYPNEPQGEYGRHWRATRSFQKSTFLSINHAKRRED